MNKLEFSTRQLFTILSTTVVATLAVFSLGLLTATLIADKPETSPIALIEGRAPAAAVAEACVEQPLPAAEQTVSVQEPPAPPAERPRYGVQIAVFEQLENAIKLAALYSDTEFQARIFSKQASGSKTVYPVLVGLFGNMDEAQQAKLSFHARFAADSFVTDATLLQEEIALAPTVAMVH